MPHFCANFHFQIFRFDFPHNFVIESQSYFGIPLTMDKEVQPGLTQSFASDIRPLAEMILKVTNALFTSKYQVLQDAGHNLVNRRIDTIAEFILSAIAKDKEPHAARVISELIQMFPAFNDKAMYKGKVFLKSNAM